MAGIEEADAEQQAVLERVQRLVRDGQNEEAVESLRRLMDVDSGRLMAVTDPWERSAGFERWSTIREAGAQRLAAWADEHPEALALYRDRVDATAERWYRQGVAERDVQRLSRVVEQLPMSRWADDAWLAWGDLALERGELLVARRAWDRLLPQRRTPASRSPRLQVAPGRPWWLTVEARSLAQSIGDWRELLQAPLDGSAWRAYPDSDRDLAELEARAVMTSILAGDLERAAIELELLKARRGEARGKLGGREGLWRDLLGALLEEARDWPTRTRDEGDWPIAGGDAGRNRSAVRGLDVPGRVAWKWPAFEAESPLVGNGRSPQERDGLSGPPVSWPVVLGEQVVFVAGRRVVSLGLFDGRPTKGQAVGSGRETPPEEDGRDLGVVFELLPAGDQEIDDDAVLGRLPGWVAGRGRVAYAVLGGGTWRRGGRGGAETLPSAFVALDLAAEGRLLFRVGLEGADWDIRWKWGGGPVPDEQAVYVPLLRADGVRSEVHVAAFDPRSGRLLWRQFVCSDDTPRRREEAEVTLTLSDDLVFCGTQRGAIAALRRGDGRVTWLVRYPRLAEGDEMARREGEARETPGTNWLVAAGDQLVAAPLDSNRLFMLDANHGQVQWSTGGQRGVDAAMILGVTSNHVVAAGERLYWLDRRTGAPAGVAPAGASAPAPGVARGEPRGAGRGVLAGREVWWPTRDAILVLERASPRGGARADGTPAAGAGGALAGVRGVRRIDLVHRATRGGNLTIVGNVLLVHRAGQIEAFVGTPLDVEPLPDGQGSATLKPAPSQAGAP